MSAMFTISQTSTWLSPRDGLMVENEVTFAP